jgi:SAM-dependent methyltransferase
MEFSDLARLASAHVEARIIQAAVELGIFDLFRNQHLSARAVSSVLRTDLRATELLLNALTALGLLEKSGEDFYTTPVSRKYLLRDSAHYFGDMILFEASLWSCWERLADAIRTGKPVRTPDMYQYDAKETGYFINGMDSLVKARGDAEVVADVLDWSAVTEMLDLGSGPATYPIQLCRRFPDLRATIFDLPGTMNLTERFVREAGLADRVRLVTGDYRTDTIPGRYDVIFMSNIIHGESHAENERLMSKLVSNLVPGGRLIVKDHILDENRTHPPVGAVFSLLMLLTTQGGQCYTFAEVKAWFTEAGLKNIQQIDLPAPLTSSLVIGER